MMITTHSYGKVGLRKHKEAVGDMILDRFFM